MITTAPKPSTMPFAAAFPADSTSSAPRFREMLELIPTPIPVDMAPIIIVTGKARVTAARLSLLILATNIESTEL